MSDLRDIVERLLDRDAVVLSGLFHAIPTMAEAAAEIASLRAQLATSQELCTKFEAAVGEDVGEMLRLREQIASARKAAFEECAAFVEEHYDCSSQYIAECIRDLASTNEHQNSDGSLASGMQMEATGDARTRRPAHPMDTISGGPLGPSEASLTDEYGRQPSTLGGTIASVYGSLDAEDCRLIDREWARQRGYILPDDGTSTLKTEQGK